MAQLSETQIVHEIDTTYGRIAQSQLGDLRDSATSQVTADVVAAAFGYSVPDLAKLPAGANMGLSCGNPVGVASIKEVSSTVSGGWTTDNLVS